ncbi:DEAD/DEAH box helicase [Massilia cavernae]|uniref:DEAD/DEAH box helicase n=1 Tax=Massilia cavernae TaxID=2320864 RepID=A0A418XAR2_9BURK|nr:DEAD/DEAH box helicase [Massilia cavernae]RJG09458.1 DEAD/DEAH box helicase [Massilia cavernae]
MTAPEIRARFEASEPEDKIIAAILALVGEPVGASRLGEYLAAAGIDAGDVDARLLRMRQEGMLATINGRGTIVSAGLAWPAIRHAVEAGKLHALRRAYYQVNPLRRDWQGFVVLRSYRQGVALLRMALVGGDEPDEVGALLEACVACHEAAYLHPIVDICARPFEPGMFEHMHPSLVDMVLTVLVNDVQRDPATAPALREFAERHVAQGAASMNLRIVLAEHLILCGRLDDAARMLGELDDSLAMFFRSVILLLRDDHALALTGFEQALKLLRRETGKRKICFPGIGGHLYMLALIRTGEAKHDKLADAYLDAATRAVQSHDTAVYEQLSMLRRIRGGTVDVDVLPSRNWETALQPFMFRALMHHWLSLPQLKDKREALEQMLEQSELAGFDLVSSQLAAVLGEMGSIGHEQRAIALRQRHRLPDMTGWFEREESWQRQLNALINLQPAITTEVVKEGRLVWLIDYDARYGVRGIEPLEQRRDAKGGWSKGRPVALKRLYSDGGSLDFVSVQDLSAIGAIKVNRYYRGDQYELNADRAVQELIGHPLLFWKDSPGTRVELLPGEPELMVRAQGSMVTITMQPPIDNSSDDVCVTRESPTRLRVVRVKPEHRSVGAIIGEGLQVPLHAEKQVLKAISAISLIVTVQSDIGSSAADIEQVKADSRLHVHLLPYQHGLKMHVLVRPLPGAGAYYAPGSGAESVIADVEGVRTEARRDLNAEREAERQLVASCLALEEAEAGHGEWLLAQPLACLELLAQLQELDPATVTIAWPEGQSFRVARKVESSSVRLSIKRDKDWFAADAEVTIDEDKVVSLRTLLDMVKSGKGRFVELGDNQFAALSTELHKRLMDLVAFSDQHGIGVRVHPLASFALQELAADAGGVKADKLWKEHLSRIDSSAAFEPKLPSTLQAELRDYQHEGYDWLARLAHWGVGACLADDMGLGKTLQALALILSRAPQGPTLVVAPTSVCTNWMAEAARFAPTLNVKLFGGGDRAAMLDEVQPFDLVVASYGLLQLEAEMFSKVKWHTIVLDEAQAIKNNATKRSAAVMALQGNFRMVATGTPLENHLGELWNLFRFINPGLLGTNDQFNLKFAGPIERAQDKRAAAAARARLKRLIQPFILRRTKSQVLSELPPRTEIVLPVDQTAEEAALYETLRRDALAKLASLEGPESQKSIQILAEMMKLRRACCNPQLVAPELGLQSSKLTVFGRLLEGLLENRHKVLVFSQFVDHLTLIRKHLDAKGVRYQYLDGSTSMQARKERVDAFQAGDGDVFLISLKAGGVGINLTAADYVIHMDPWWNPAVEDQASDRAHRMGQQRPVTIYRLVAKNTIEEGIVDLHKHKRDLADSLLEGSDAAARLSPSDMLKMLQEGLGH